MSEKKTLLEKYMIPIEHLDFDYVNKCENIKELERILEILKSGEEGYYPDLTSATEKQLKKIDPYNRAFRSEIQCHQTGQDERKQLNVNYFTNQFYF